VVNLDGTRPDASISHEEALKYVRAALKEFPIRTGREERFDASLAEKAGEAKPEKVNGKVVSVEGKKFKLKPGRGKEIEISATDATKITRGQEGTTFETVVTVGATLNLEVINGVAISIASKN
jgi:hypothetical protein